MLITIVFWHCSLLKELTKSIADLNNEIFEFCFKRLRSKKINTFERSNQEQATKLLVSINFLKKYVQNKMVSVVDCDVLKPN